MHHYQSDLSHYVKTREWTIIKSGSAYSRLQQLSVNRYQLDRTTLNCNRKVHK